MKQIVMIAGVLGAGVALGGLGVAGYQHFSHDAAAPGTMAASVPAAVASAPAAIAAASAPVASAPAAQVAAVTPPEKAAPRHAAYARVLGVKPVVKLETAPREVCAPEQVVRRAPPQDEHRVTGTVVGGLLGGVLGNQVGGGNGKKIATVVGAIAGGYAGNQAQERMQERDTVTVTENRCHTEDAVTKKVVGYDVRYSLDGRVGTVRMDHKPGKRIPARNGELLLP
ncbi:glycine zipper 2TM domain-containing protein [Paludibacterium paludis]|uniref:Glycine zipper 2TM domain-containing protein n=1 Tax=Paludibacterium paludis TaxID=1225769 RepID=A0A918P476_9NEIS|nr:glycine zipper 2TM domain-containing protein [Paludibacterium paludis]GGY19036.1 hypothetical protein GCM10011289_23050 [Paludibacterium paludis]